jgi:hypothetical protein
MTEEHKTFIDALSKKAPFTAAALQRHWTKGKKYYIDKRVYIPGHRRTFERLNKEMAE